MDTPGRLSEHPTPGLRMATPLQEIVMPGMKRKSDFTDYVRHAESKRVERESVDLPSYVLKDSGLDCTDVLSYGLEFYIRSLPLIQNRINTPFMYTVCYQMIAHYENSLMTAVLGLGIWQEAVFTLSPTQLCVEICGISCSKAYKDKDYPKMRVSFMRSLIINLAMITVISIFLANISVVLLAMNFDKNLSLETEKFIVQMIPVIFIKTLVEQLRGCIESQGISVPFVCFNVITMIMYPYAGWYFIWKHQYGFTGVVMVKLISEIINLIGCYSILTQRQPQASAFECSQKCFELNPILQFLKKWSKIFVDWGVGCLGVNLIMVIIGSLNDLDLFCAWVIYFNLVRQSWTSFLAVGQVIKTDVTLALSQGNKHQAKKLALMGLNLSFLAGALFSVLVWIFRRSIAWQYSTVPSVLGILETMIETGSLFLFLTGPIPGFLGIGRTIGYENTVTGVRLVCSMVIATIVYYILYCTDLPKGYVAWAMGVQAVLYYILFCGSYSMLDWNKLELPERRPSVLYKLKNEGVFELQIQANRCDEEENKSYSSTSQKPISPKRTETTRQFQKENTGKETPKNSA